MENDNIKRDWVGDFTSLAEILVLIYLQYLEKRLIKTR